MKAVFNAGALNARIAAMKMILWAAERNFPVFTIFLNNGGYYQDDYGAALEVRMRPGRLFVQYNTSGHTCVTVLINRRTGYIIMEGSSYNIMRRGSLIYFLWHMRWGGDLKLYSTWGEKLQDILEASGRDPYAHTEYIKIEADYRDEGE